VRLHDAFEKWPNGNPLLQLRQNCCQETLLLFGFATCALAALAPRPTRLTRQGYNAKVLAELLNAKSREINSFLSGQLGPGRTNELHGELLAAGIPL
jgi:hypothetical protein